MFKSVRLSRRWWLVSPTRTLLAFGLVLASSGCSNLATQRRNVYNEAQDFATASRFGRLDVASGYAAQEAMKTFLQRRRKWGSEIQVLDMQVSNVQIKDSEHAEVTLQVDWSRASEGLLRSTWLAQQWRSSKQGPWRLQSERRERGDRGLFGEKAQAKSLGPARDMHFQTRSLGSVP